MFETTLLELASTGLSGETGAAGGAAFDLGRGAIAGALVIGAAFLAGFAAIRRSGTAFAALLMVAALSALQFSWLGLTPSLPEKAGVFLLGLFAAAAVVFVSATVSAARNNAIIGGVLFSGALVLASLGVLNFLDRFDVAPLVAWGAAGVGAFAALLAGVQAFRGDRGAQLILPGAAIAVMAPLVGPLGAVEAGGAVAGHGVFVLGVLAASLVALTDSIRPAMGAALQSPPSAVFGASTPARFAGDAARSASDRPAMPASPRAARERAEIVIDSQLGKVLDYSGIGIWDWSHDFIDQTASVAALLGADSDSPFTPDALRQFVQRDDLKKLESEIFIPEDGAFDVELKLFNGAVVRMRGARAADDDDGALERIVAFIEPVADESGAAPAPAAAAIAPFDVRKVTAAFQPVVSLTDMRIVGYETLARLGGEESDTAQLIRDAAHAGKSGVLAERMLRQAADFLVKQSARHDGETPLFVAMNVSWTQMKDPAFASAVAHIMTSHELKKGSLVLELTEGEAVADAPDAAAVFRKLKGLGAALAFDDFGAGFSCLSNVRKYDFDYIKIDKSFAEDLAGDGGKIVAALARMGDELGLKVIIEGVESEAAAKAAAALGCAFGQGYALGRPAADGATASAARGAPRKAIAKPVADEKTAEDAIALTPQMAMTPANDEKPMRWRPWARSR